MKWHAYLLLGLAAGLSLATGGAEPVQAESASVKVFLYYMPSVSNYGPTSATGVAMLNVSDGELTLDVDGLPLVAGLAYEVWLSVSTEPVAMLSLGKFNPGAGGSAHYHQIVEDLPRADYRYIILSVEPDPDPSPAPSARRSIAGVIPDIAALAPTPTTAPVAPAAAGAATATAVAGAPTPKQSGPAETATPPPPSRLPTTGGADQPWEPVVALAFFGSMAMAALFLFVRGRRA